MRFPGFLGNEGVKETLSAALSAGRFPHAIMLEGEPGSGKRTLAGLISRALVCRSPEERPCGVCPGCLRAMAGSHPDIREIKGGGATGALTVESIQGLTGDAQRMPEEADVNVYILHIGERTLPAAQNKLLKLIEEPPGAAVFILICPSAGAVLPTIRSRAQAFVLRPPEPEDAAGWLASQGDVDLSRARELAMLCGGNLGRMQEELQEGAQAKALDIAREMASAMLDPGGHSLLKAAAPLQRDRALFRQVLERLEGIFRDACMLRAAGRAQTLLGASPSEADRLSALPAGRLYSLPGLIEDFRQKLDRNANTTLLLTCFCARLRK